MISMTLAAFLLSADDLPRNTLNNKGANNAKTAASTLATNVVSNRRFNVASDSSGLAITLTNF